MKRYAQAIAFALAIFTAPGCAKKQHQSEQGGPMEDMPAIHRWAEEGDVEKVAEILRADPSQVHRILDADRPGAGDTPLHYAAQQNREAVVDLLLQYGADINARGEEGMTPLHLAGHSGSPLTAQILIQTGADIEARDDLGRTPLLRAAAGKYPESKDVIVLLIRHGADLRAKDKNGRGALELVIGNKEVAELLVQQGLPLDLNSAMLLWRTDTVRSLLKNDSHLVQKTRNPEWVLPNAVYMIDKMICKKGGLQDRKKAEAIIKENLDIFEMLLAQGARITVALVESVQLPDPTLAEFLLQHGANPNLPITPGGDTAFTMAHFNIYCKDEMIALLRKHGAKEPEIDPNVQEPAVVELMKSLKDKNPVNRYMAAKSLGFYRHRARNAVPALLEALKDPDKSVRSAAGKSLKLIDPAAAAEAGIH